MKKNFFIISLTFILGLASCSFTTREFNESDRDKLLMQIISYVLDQGHFVKKDINDEFSKKVFNDYMQRIDPYKRYFYKSDIDEFKKYEYELDDQFLNAQVDFFELTYNRSQLRFNESQSIYKEILGKPFNYQLDEDFNADDLPGLYGTEDDKSEGMKQETKTKPGLGYVAGVVALGLSGYLIRERGITMQDITG